LDRRLGGPQSRSGRCGEEKKLQLWDLPLLSNNMRQLTILRKDKPADATKHVSDETIPAQFDMDPRNTFRNIGLPKFQTLCLLADKFPVVSKKKKNFSEAYMFVKSSFQKLNSSRVNLDIDLTMKELEVISELLHLTCQSIENVEAKKTPRENFSLTFFHPSK
jgi:hypothetical protein